MAERVKSVKAWAAVIEGVCLTVWAEPAEHLVHERIADLAVGAKVKYKIIPVLISPLPAKKKGKVKRGK